MRAATLAWSGVLLSGALLAAQERPSFRTGVELVTVPVSVEPRDHDTAPPPMTPADFRVLEDGQEQRIAAAAIDRRAVSLAIALDVSGSMAGLKQELAAETVRAVFSLLDPRDEIALVAFAGEIAVPLVWARAGQIPGLDWVQWVLPPGRTPLRDAVAEALMLMDSAEESRHVVLVVSDGFEQGSTVAWPSLVTTRRQSETEVHGLRIVPWRDRQRPRGAGPADRVSFMPGLDALGEIVGDSGGVVREIDSPDRVTTAAMAFAASLRNQYLVAYETSRPLDGTYRRIKVEALNRDLRIRHRGGYLALPSSR